MCNDTCNALYSVILDSVQLDIKFFNNMGLLYAIGTLSTFCLVIITYCIMLYSFLKIIKCTKNVFCILHVLVGLKKAGLSVWSPKSNTPATDTGQAILQCKVSVKNTPAIGMYWSCNSAVYKESVNSNHGNI